METSTEIQVKNTSTNKVDNKIVMKLSFLLMYFDQQSEIKKFALEVDSIVKKLSNKYFSKINQKMQITVNIDVKDIKQT